MEDEYNTYTTARTEIPTKHKNSPLPFFFIFNVDDDQKQYSHMVVRLAYNCTQYIKSVGLSSHTSTDHVYGATPCYSIPIHCV